MVRAVLALLAGLKNPPRTLTEELDILRAQGLTQTADRIAASANERGPATEDQ